MGLSQPIQTTRHPIASSTVFLVLQLTQRLWQMTSAMKMQLQKSSSISKSRTKIGRQDSVLNFSPKSSFHIDVPNIRPAENIRYKTPPKVNTK